MDSFFADDIFVFPRADARNPDAPSLIVRDGMFVARRHSPVIYFKDRQGVFGHPGEICAPYLSSSDVCRNVTDSELRLMAP